jgi:RNA polymerase sigma-70 factor (ECF subfamily)
VKEAPLLLTPDHPAHITPVQRPAPKSRTSDNATGLWPRTVADARRDRGQFAARPAKYKIVRTKNLHTLTTTWRALLLARENLSDRFEQLVLPHLDSAYNLARWLLRDEQDAKDAVQEAVLRAFRFFDQLRGENARPWLLKIVRNTSMTWLHDKRVRQATPLDDRDSYERSGSVYDSQDPVPDPEELMLAKIDRETINSAIERLPTEFKEVLLLREFEDLSYKEIAGILEIPIGTVMSRLARARALIAKTLGQETGQMVRK